MANTIEYKGYIGSIEYSPEDKCFFGKLEMIDDLVTFEADNTKELESNFQNAVDEYLETCVALGREPQKAYKGVFNVRIEPELHRKLYQEAVKARVSLNSFVRQALLCYTEMMCVTAFYFPEFKSKVQFFSIENHT